MIDFELAKQKITENIPNLGHEVIDFSKALGYTLAQEITVKEPIPIFDSSAVDGYAVYVADIQHASDDNPIALPIQMEIPAGSPSDEALQKNYAAKIFTGAVVPKNAQAVVMREVTEQKDTTVYIKDSAKMGENIRQRGEEFSQGAVVFTPGTSITPATIGLLATLGYPQIQVYRKPKISIIITGDELKLPGETLQPGQIRESNSFALQSSLHAMGIDAVEILRVKDDPKAVLETFAKALKESDVIISSGGVSVGDYDFVKQALQELNVTTIFGKIAMKPGKPNYFGVRDNKLIFGLPGNPVSAMVSFYLLIRPALLQMSGIKVTPLFQKAARCNQDIRKRPGRLEFVRGFAEQKQGQWCVSVASRQGSHMMGGLALSNCLIHFAKERDVISQGEEAPIELLQWYLV